MQLDNIDASELENSIGTTQQSFKGEYDGNGYTISNLENILFSSVEDASLRRVQIKDVNINESGGNVGTLVGIVYGSSTIK